MENQNEFIIKLAVDAWQLQINSATKLFDTLTEEQLQKQVTPNSNTGVYLLGHLTGIHDALFTLLGIGDRLHRELDEVFVKQADNSTIAKPSVAELKKYWKEVNDLLNEKLTTLTPNEWLDRHNSISNEDFKNEPHSNKLNIFFSRTSHVAYHLGQLAFLKHKPVD